MLIYSIKATDIVLFAFILIALGVISYFLFKGVIKEYHKTKEEKLYKLEGVITKNELMSLISTYMNRTGLKSRYTLIYLDLDKFEDFNLAFGEKESKKILQNISNKIKKIIPSTAFLSRFTKDDFIVFLSQEHTQMDVLNYTKALLKSFQEKTIVYGDEEIDLTASIAVAEYPNHGSNFKELYESLKLAMYSVKKSGGNSYKIFNLNLIEEGSQKDFYFEVKEAIANNDFKLHYQPIMDFETNLAYSLEALIRWDHREMGILLPSKFLNVMEQSGDIHWIGQWGMEELAKMYISMVNSKIKTIPLLSLNLSSKQLMSPNLVSNFEKIMKKHKLNPQNFTLEVGEFNLFEKHEVVINNILKLSEANFKVSVGGFGIDIMSFEKLSELRINEVKLRYDTISENTYSVNKYVEVLQEYLKENNKKLVCQAIENEIEEKRVKSLGINYGQGFYYSKVTDESETIEFLLNNEK